MTRRPDTFIIGAPKAGTTSLYAYLREHPQVFMSREKEPEYFAPDMVHMRRGRPFVHPQDEGRYLALFSRATTQLRVGEASASYLASHEAPRLLKRFQPDARYIAIVRNPVDLLYSLHGHRVAHGSEWIEDFAAALEADEDRRNGRNLQLGRAGRGAAYRDYAMLGEQLRRWFDEIGRERIHTIVFDDFIANTAVEYAKVLRFLEVDEALEPAATGARNVSHRRRSGLMPLVFQNSLVRWVSRQALPAVVGERATAKLARRVDRQRFVREPVTIKPMAAETRAQLELEFNDDVTELGALIGRDLQAEWFRRGQHDAAA